MEETPPGLPDWDEKILELGNPGIMDTPTLIEWIQRHLETDAQTTLRHNRMAFEHEAWHATAPGMYGVFSCCVQTNPYILTVNERRMSQSAADLQKMALEAFKKYDQAHRVMYIPEGMTVTPIPRKEKN